MYFILNMYSGEKLAAVAVVYILQRKKKRKSGKNVALGWNLGSREKMPLGFTTLYNLQHLTTLYNFP